MGNGSKMTNNALNYKIVRCKNFDKDGTCKYGAHCTFAHGDAELRNKTQNLYQMNNQMMMMPMMSEMYPMPIMMPNPGMDMTQMQQMIANGNVNPNIPNQFMMMNMMPTQSDGINNNEKNNADPQGDVIQQIQQ